VLEQPALPWFDASLQLRPLGPRPRLYRVRDGAVDCRACVGVDGVGMGSNGSSIGATYDGALGSGASDCSNDPATAAAPVPISIPGAIGSVFAGLNRGYALTTSGGVTTIFLTQAGQVTAWGADIYGELGAAGALGSTESASGVQVPLPSGVTGEKLAAGPSYDVALGSDGNMYSWGADNTDQVGPNATSAGAASASAVVQVPFPQQIMQIAAGGDPGIGNSVLPVQLSPQKPLRSSSPDRRTIRGGPQEPPAALTVLCASEPSRVSTMFAVGVDTCEAIGTGSGSPDRPPRRPVDGN